MPTDQRLIRGVHEELAGEGVIAHAGEVGRARGDAAAVVDRVAILGDPVLVDLERRDGPVGAFRVGLEQRDVLVRPRFVGELTDLVVGGYDFKGLALRRVVGRRRAKPCADATASSSNLSA